MVLLDREVSNKAKIDGLQADVDGARVLITPEDARRIVDRIKNLIPSDWLVGRTWDETIEEFVHIVKNGELPSRKIFFLLNIPDQKLFLQFLGTAVSLGIISGTMLTHWASATFGSAYLSTFGWFMVPIGVATSILINKIDKERERQQKTLVDSIKKDAVHAAEIVEKQQRVAKIFTNLLTGLQKEGYRPNDTMLGLLQKVASLYGRPTTDRYAQTAIAKLEAGDDALFFRNSDDSFSFPVLGMLHSDTRAYLTREELLKEMEQRLKAALHEMFDDEE